MCVGACVMHASDTCMCDTCMCDTCMCATVCTCACERVWHVRVRRNACVCVRLCDFILHDYREVDVRSVCVYVECMSICIRT